LTKLLDQRSKNGAEQHEIIRLIARYKGNSSVLYPFISPNLKEYVPSTNNDILNQQFHGKNNDSMLDSSYVLLNKPNVTIVNYSDDSS